MKEILKKKEKKENAFFVKIWFAIKFDQINQIEGSGGEV